MSWNMQHRSKQTATKLPFSTMCVCGGEARKGEGGGEGGWGGGGGAELSIKSVCS